MYTFNNLIKLFLSCYVIIIQILPTLSEDNDGRIVGGVPTEIKFAPYLVQIRNNDAIICSGTLVSEYIVITAAHCFMKNPKKLSVVGGASKIYNDPGTARSEVKRYIVHPGYDNNTFHKDIAIIRLEQPLTGSLIEPISMDCDEWEDVARVKLLGWGKRNETDKAISVQLQTVEVEIIGHGWCKWLYFKRRIVTDAMFCAASEGKDACSGDSGGPALVNNQFCGIVSWGVGCADKESPGVYTNLRKLKKFVTKAIEQLKK